MARSIWGLALVLLLLLAITSGLYAADAKDMAATDLNVITIDANYTLENGVLKPLFSNTRMAPAKSRLNRGEFTAVTESGKNDSTAPAGWSPKLNVEDEEGVWRQSRLIDIFHPVYFNSEGEVTVLSENGADRLIAPGTGETYYFSLKNAGNVALNYWLSIESLYEPGEVYIPIQVRLRCGNQYVVGSATSWASPDELNEYFRSGTLAVGKYEDYYLDWDWPIEDADGQPGIDELDTYLGQTALDRDIEYYIQINVRAEATPNATPTSTPTATARGTAAGSAIYKTGNLSLLWLWLLLMLLAALAAAAVVRWMKKDGKS